MIRRLAVWGAVLIAAAVLARWLQGTFEDLCIVPAVELLQMGGLLLRSIPQWVCWSLLVVIVSLIASGSLATAGSASFLHLERRAKEKQAATPGPVGKLAYHLHNTRRGPYFKWLVAHRLGELAQACRIQRGTSKAEGRREMGIEGNGDRKVVDIQAYIEAGLGRPPMSHPLPWRGSPWRRFLSRQPPTPLDLDPSWVVEYLESQKETKV